MNDHDQVAVTDWQPVVPSKDDGHAHMFCFGRSRDERQKGHGDWHPAGYPVKRKGDCIVCGLSVLR
jgi:hypothetical protein